ncbi:MAG TPA: EAL domain-containing protein [Steroidobacteraceae bacterium]|nr:EAL domain-containing protein [Steroidobacteraceae bacterium]
MPDDASKGALQQSGSGNQRAIEANRLLIVADAASRSDEVRQVAARLGYAVHRVSPQGDIAAAFAEVSPTLVLLNLAVNSVDALWLLRRIARTRHAAPLVYAGRSDARTARTVELMARGSGVTIDDSLALPIDVRALSEALIRFKRCVPVCAGSDLRRAIRRGAVDGSYQPCVRLAGGATALAGAEIHAHWDLETGVRLHADEFAGLYADPQTDWALFHRMLWLAHQAQARWRAAGVTVPVTLGFSARLLDSPYAAALSESWLECAVNRLPITLKLRARDVDGTRACNLARLGELRAIGYHIALAIEADDLWSMRDVGRWPADEIILRPSLTQSLAGARDRRMLVSVLIRAARAAHVLVRADGVQDSDALEAIMDLGITRLQGRLIGTSLSQAQLVDWASMRDRPARLHRS